MADTLNNGEFWLPSEFLTDDDILMDMENLNKNGLNAAFGADFGFPNEFPYDFGSCGSSSALSSPVESVVGSTETESDEDLLAGLTRSTMQEKDHKITNSPQNLEKPWVFSGSPQSTLSALGSWSGRSAASSNGSPNGPSQVPSPPTTPLGGNNDAWDLIYAAAGQVARLKMNDEGPPKVRGLLAPPWSLAPVQHRSPPVKNPNAGFYGNQYLSRNLSQTNLFEHARQDQVLKKQSASIWGRPTEEGFFSQQNQLQQQLMAQNRRGIVLGGEFESNGRFARPVDLPQSAWPSLQVQHQNHQNQPTQHGGSDMRAVFLGGSGVKKECAGTGVFLPRRYGNPSEARKKPGCATALIPARVVHALNQNFADVTVQAQAPAQTQARFSCALIPDHDTLMARRNALFTQQKQRSLRPEGPVNHELCLPKEWTY